MRVGVLGELVVTDGGVELAVKGPIPRRLIALLAIRAGEFVHADTLADQVWAGAPPPAARATLQSHMARLRRAVGAERFESGRAGYRLAAERSDVDAHRFVELAEKGRVAIAAGDVAAARGALDDALSLWRGPAYAEFGGYPALDSEAARLHQLRVDVRQWQFEAELAGPGAPPVAAIEAMVREHPTREGLWVLLMKALYRVGRQADALRAYQSARRFLLDELGIEPSRELREVEQMILMHDSALDPTISTTAPTAVPSETPQPPAEEIRERRTVTTAVIELPLPTVADPEDIAARSRVFRDLVRECVAAHDGTVYAELEGLVVAVFGLRRARTNDAVRAVRAAMAVIERSSAEPRPRAAAGTGEAVVTAAAGRTELSGPVLTATDQLRTLAAPGVVLVDDATKPFIDELAALQPAHGGWRVGSLATGPNRRRSSSQFVGREHDMSLLRDAFDKALNDRRPQLVSVEADAGLGKTRLLQEFEARLVTDGVAVTFWRSQCPPTAEAPMSPIAHIVRAVAAISDTTSLDTASAAVRSLLPPEETDTLLPRVLACLGTETANTPSLLDSLAAWRRFVELGVDRPTVLVVEDLHWAADLVLDFVASLASIGGPCPLVVVTTTRPELRERRPSWGAGSTTLWLSALTEQQTVTLIDNLTSDVAISDSDRTALIARSGGIPLFAEELARLAGHEPAQVGPVVVSPALSAVIAARIDTLDAPHRAALSAAAVVGPTFWSDQLSALLGTDEEKALQLAEELARRAFVERVRPSQRTGHREFALTHELIREAAEQRLTREDRARHHLAAFDWWVNNITDARDAHAATLAHHACSAYDLAVASGRTDLAEAARTEAGSSALAAGQRLQGIDTPAALRFLSRAVELIDPGSPDYAKALAWYGATLSDDRDFATAERYIADALERMEHVNDPLRVEVSQFLLTCHFAQGHDLASVDAAIRRARTELPPSRAAVRNLGTLATLRLMEQTTESLRAAIAICDEALALAQTHSTGGDALARVVRARARLSLGDGDALDDLESALDEVVETESGTIALGARQWHAGAMHHWRGPAAERASRDALALLVANRGLQLITSMSLAEDIRVTYELGDLRGAIAMAEDVPFELEAQPRWAIVQRGLALLDLGELSDEVVADVLATPPADAGDLRHILGAALVAAGAALDTGNLPAAAAAVTSVGELQQYVDRDGAVELLPRYARTAIACELPNLVEELAGIDAVPTPLRRSIAATISGLVAEAAGDHNAAVANLSHAADGWRELGFRVEEALTRVDLARNLIAAGDADAEAASAAAESSCETLGIKPILGVKSLRDG